MRGAVAAEADRPLPRAARAERAAGDEGDLLLAEQPLGDLDVGEAGAGQRGVAAADGGGADPGRGGDAAVQQEEALAGP